MNHEALMLVDPPQLSDEGAVEVVGFLHELTLAFENSYQHQIRRYNKTNISVTYLMMICQSSDAAYLIANRCRQGCRLLFIYLLPTTPSN